MSKPKYCLLAILLPLLTANAQQKPLAIGDTLPDIPLHNIYNYPAHTARLSDFSGKLVILDFWATWCGACIAAFPKLETLQKTFGDKIQVLLINTASTGDEEKKIAAYFSARTSRTGGSVTLPYVVKDTMLVNYFPYRYVPHYVWLSGNRTVIAITPASEVTAANIQSVLSGNAVKMHQKKDMLAFDSRKPLFIDGNGEAKNALLFRSTVTRYIEGIGYGRGKNTDDSGNVTRFYMLNTPLMGLYTTAFKEQLHYPPNRTIIDVSHPELFAADTVDYNNRFCYEIITPGSSMKDILTQMQKDLQNVFHVTAKTEKRNMKIWLLDTLPGITRSFSHPGASASETDKNGTSKYLQNITLGSLTELLNAFLPIPVIDETGLSKDICIRLPVEIASLDMKAIKKMLTQYGLSLTESTRDLDIALITNK